ncbi:lactadherin-like [Asterias amurensis]|uniref:lactadherin-like n=1 Tax=Asterias amurensis TaxID=7602 RepID=UPI003AB281DD
MVAGLRLMKILESAACYTLPTGEQFQQLLNKNFCAAFCIECSKSEPLGLEDGSIPDESISASSIVAGEGRLNGEAWCAWSDGLNAWFEVDLGESTVVSGLITQGYDKSWHWRVTEYKVKYKKISSSDYEHVKDNNGAIQVFEGNIDDSTTRVTNMFDQSIVATTVRIEPVAFIEIFALRLELLGCHIN